MPPVSVPLPADLDVIAPDGSEVRMLVRSERGSMAHFQLAPGGVSIAVRHASVEELWFVVQGRGEMWLGGEVATVVTLEHGVSVRVAAGTPFQFRCFGPEPLGAVAVTMPPWPTDHEEALP
ncbi:MAG TPA: cupin domain-containing protein, partial [Acidimicrobiales bacterium]